jgi:hypothetical protein
MKALNPVGKPMLLVLQLNDGLAGKYPLADIYDATNTHVDSLRMSPGNTIGSYVVSYVPLNEGQFYVVYRVYTSNLYNVLDAYTLVMENFDVGTLPSSGGGGGTDVWDTPLSAHLQAGTTGAALSQIATKVSNAPSVPDALSGLTPDRISRLDLLDTKVSTRAPADVLNSVSAKTSALVDAVAALQANGITAAQIWGYATRTLTQKIEVQIPNLDALATKADLAGITDILKWDLTSWQASGSFAVDPKNDTIDMAVWLSENGTVVLQPDQASVSLYDSSGTLIFALGPLGQPSGQGVIHFSRPSASGIIAKSRTYVMKVDIAYQGQTYSSNISISTY